MVFSNAEPLPQPGTMASRTSLAAKSKRPLILGRLERTGFTEQAAGLRLLSRPLIGERSV